MDTVSPLEIIWTALAIVGLGYAVWNLREAFLDLAALLQDGSNGDLLVVAGGALRNESERVLYLAGFIVVGAIFMFLPNGTGATSIARSIVAVVFLGLEVRTVYGTWADRQDRLRWREHYQLRNRRAGDVPR